MSGEPDHHHLGATMPFDLALLSLLVALPSPAGAADTDNDGLEDAE